MAINLPLNSRYNHTDIVTHNGHETLGVWPGFSWINDPPAETVIAKPEYAGRLDRMAQDYLGAPDLWWVIMYYNHITDITWPRPGDVVNLPSLSSVLEQK